jgi:hypothetical protein
MSYTASFQACHRSSPLREKSGPFSGQGNRRIRLLTEARKSAPCDWVCRGTYRGSRCQLAVSGRQYAVELWRVGQLEGAARLRQMATGGASFLNRGKHRRTDARTTTSSSLRLRTQRVSVGIALAQTTRAGCCEHPARLSTPLTWGEKSLTNANLSRPRRLFNHSRFFARSARAQQQLVGHNREDFAPEPALGAGTTTSLLDHASGARPKY